MSRDVYVDGLWSCATCQKRGEVRVWVPPAQTKEQALYIQGMSTRGRCVAGCTIRFDVATDAATQAQAAEPGKSKDDESVAMDKEQP